MILLGFVIGSLVTAVIFSACMMKRKWDDIDAFIALLKANRTDFARKVQNAILERAEFYREDPAVYASFCEGMDTAVDILRKIERESA